MRETYRHSGRLGLGLLTAPLVGLLAAAVAAPLYAYIDVYSPIAGVVTLLVVAGLGFGVGLAVSWGAKLGRLRNQTVTHLLGLAVGFVTLYLSWAWFEWVLARQADQPFGLTHLAGLLFSPGVMWDMASGIAETGWFTIKGATPSGGFLWFIWGLEALMIVGLVTLAAGSLPGDAVYCEQRGRWVKGWAKPILLRPPSDPTAIGALAQADPHQLEALPTAGALEYPRLTVEVYADDPPATAAYQVKLETQKLDAKGKPELKKTDVSPKLVLYAGEVERLRTLAARAPAPQTEAAPG